MRGPLSNREMLCFALAILAGLPLYFHTARVQSQVNVDLGKSDQSAYMEFAVRAYETQFRETGGRARMPLYPWFMALFYSPDMSEEAYFQLGKVINTHLSALILCLLAAMFARRFSLLYACYALLCIAFLAFAIKAPWFQAEVLLYGLYAAAFIRAVDTLRYPTGWRGGAQVGILIALAHFTKALGLIFLACYVAASILGWATRITARKRSPAMGAPPAQALINAAACTLAFLLTLSPYLVESYHRYGSHFYNVNTTFYIWYDSIGDAFAGAKAAGDREGYPDLPPEEIPSLARYLREHTPRQILERFTHGAEKLVKRACQDTKYRYEFGYCSQVALGLMALVPAALWLLAKSSRRELIDQASVIFFVTAALLGYSLSSFWYAYMSAAGPRAFLVLLVPFYWTIGLLFHSRTLYGLRFQWRSVFCRVSAAIFAILGVTLVYEIYQTVVYRAAIMYGGK